MLRRPKCSKIEVVVPKEEEEEEEDEEEEEEEEEEDQYLQSQPKILLHGN
jgi:hypothetical protein